MMKAINNWLDKPLTYREMIKDTITFNAGFMAMMIALAGTSIMIDRHKKKVNKPYETDFEVERTEVKDDEE